MAHKSVGFDIKSVSESGVIEGYGSTFGGEPDSYGDIVEPGAFADSIAKHKSDGTMPLMLWGHQASDIPIGDWVEIEEDSKGLHVKGLVDIDDPVGQRVHRALKAKRVSGLSIGFATIDSRKDPKKPGITYLEKLDLWEVSVVNFPANRNAAVDMVKAAALANLRDRLAAGDRLTEREMEQLMKDAFLLSNSEAERAIRVNFKGQGEPDKSEGEEFMAALIAAMQDAPIVDLSGEDKALHR